MSVLLRRFGCRPAPSLVHAARSATPGRVARVQPRFYSTPFIPVQQLLQTERRPPGSRREQAAHEEDDDEDDSERLRADPAYYANEQDTMERPGSAAFYTGRQPYFDTMESLRNAIGQARATLKTLCLLPLPAFARDSLVPIMSNWKDAETMGADIGLNLNTTRYRRLVAVLNELNELLSIATTSGCTELADMIENVVAIFERSGVARSEILKGNFRPVELDNYGRSYTLGRRKTSSARVWMIPVMVGTPEEPKPFLSPEMAAKLMAELDVPEPEPEHELDVAASQNEDGEDDQELTKEEEAAADEADAKKLKSLMKKLDAAQAEHVELQIREDQQNEAAGAADGEDDGEYDDEEDEEDDEDDEDDEEDEEDEDQVDNEVEKAEETDTMYSEDGEAVTETDLETYGEDVEDVDEFEFNLHVSTILVNNIPLAQYFPNALDREKITYPLKVAGVLGKYNVFAIARGGGSTGQVGAIAHGIAKGLIAHNEELLRVMRKVNLIRRDPRMVERKKTGRPKARTAYRWVKR